MEAIITRVSIYIDLVLDVYISGNDFSSEFAVAFTMWSPGLVWRRSKGCSSLEFSWNHFILQRRHGILSLQTTIPSTK